MKDFNDLLQYSVRDIYNSEQQILKALPFLQRNARTSRLKEALDMHISRTERHLVRIEEVCRSLGFQPTGTICTGTLGILKEAQESLDIFRGSAVADACIIASLQKIGHYEIANYGTVISWMGEMDISTDVIDLFEQTLDEELEIDDLLTLITKEEAHTRAFEAWQESRSKKVKLL